MGSEERPIYFMRVGVSGLLSDVFAGSDVFIWYLGRSAGSSTLHGVGAGDEEDTQHLVFGIVSVSVILSDVFAGWDSFF